MPKFRVNTAAITAPQVVKELHRLYPDAHCSLFHENPFQLLVATVLSAQCTDARVNQVTPGLFRKYPDAFALAEAGLGEIEEVIRSTGFFRAKAKSLQSLAGLLVEKHGGVVPNKLDELIQLRGVGRKTANVVLGNAYGIPSLVVDTHVGRISRKLGLTRSTDPEKVEQELMKQVPKNEWVYWSHGLIEHGRQVCQARKSKCEECTFRKKCPSRS